jgi:hypothetical protein
MKNTVISVALLGGFALGCASSIPVRVEREPGPDLARFETYAFASDLESAPMDPAFGADARRLVRDELELSLRARGYRLAHPDDADMLISVGTTTAKVTDDREVHEWPAYDVTTQRTGVATPVGDVPLGSRTTVVPRAPELDPPTTPRAGRTVVMDVFDAETKDLLWRGTAEFRGGTAKKADADALLSRVRAIAARFPSD